MVVQDGRTIVDWKWGWSFSFKFGITLPATLILTAITLATCYYTLADVIIGQRRRLSFVGWSSSSTVVVKQAQSKAQQNNNNATTKRKQSAESRK